ncbi:polyphenol oxidase family protein [Candidatus Gracilibacteria bacterium]|nr:polyphenol oxidase family protein [Candidatus Gracilibacteria bacterium]
MKPFIQTFLPHENLPENIVLPQQVHGTRIVEIVTGEEDLLACDGMFLLSSNSSSNLKLGIRTADCAPICFWTPEKIGILHAGWRGLVDGIVETMLKNMETPGRLPGADLEIHVGPLLPQFEIQRDHCFYKIQERFGDAFFREKYGMLFFDFHAALRSIIPNATFDPRSTYLTPDLASWRRDRDERRNVTIISL